ncbi:MAG: AAA family ATPase [Treponema sp.]|nr:AAA family ATPase [Treponema sp.]
MFLKSLDIFGFKSFADRTHIDFADGITALLGPNGCGKSNVVDAMKWVLAENKSKNLRAATMEGVIFNGTETRPALNLAEVTLTIMNENSLLPRPDSEIAIKRRLFRSGESQYFINNEQVGPTEIRKLFMDTGVGKAAYSVMEQGKIDQILSSKPEDRRYLFEEAAGISRSKAECAEAERELEKTRTNLTQIEVALAEIKRNYDTLKVQSEKTKKYRAVKEEVFQLQLDLQLLKLKGFVERQSRNESSIKEIEKKRDDIRAEIDAINDALTENTDKIKSLQDQVAEGTQELIRIQAEKSGKLELQKQFNSRQTEINEKIAQIENHKKSIQERIDNINEELDEAGSAVHEKEKQLEDIKSNIDSFGQNITNASKRINDNDAAASEKQELIEDLDLARANLQKELASITEDIVTELDAKLKAAGYSQSGASIAKQELDETLEKLKIFVQGRKNIFDDAVKTGATSDGAKIAGESAAAFGDALEMLQKLQASLEAYIKASPQFISEFLSPEGIITKKRGVDQKIQENLAQVSELNKRIDELKKENDSLNEKISEYRETLANLQVNEAKMKEQISSAQNQMSMLRRTLTTEENNLRQNEDELYAEQKRKEDLDEQIQTVEEELVEIDERGLKTADRLKKLDEEIKDFNNKVSGKTNDLNKKQETLTKCQTQYEQLKGSVLQTETEIKNVKQNFLDQYSRDLMEYEERMYTITAQPLDLKDKLSKKRGDLEELSHGINLMAPEEFVEVKERYERQQTNYDDTLKSLKDLERVAEEIKSKSSELFLETYNKIKRNFHNMFRRLFGGGRAELRLENPENVLTTGIDILAQPPGKKLESIALLSGGEKTMTAIALLFATYQVRPSPFCLLDEIDAALDDKNVGSFVTALTAFANVSQYIVITHNKKTVMGASTMLGVTMEESGVSKIIALRLDEDIDNIKNDFDESEDNFVEEDVPPEEGVVIPPRPPRRDKSNPQTEQGQQ